jgi:hypothetical protein
MDNSNNNNNIPSSTINNNLNSPEPETAQQKIP